MPSLPLFLSSSLATPTTKVSSSSSSTIRREMLQTLRGITPRFVNRSWLRNLTVRAMTFSCSSDYGDQSRGGLPHFYSEILPPSKASFSSPFSLLCNFHTKSVCLCFCAYDLLLLFAFTGPLAVFQVTNTSPLHLTTRL